MITTLRISVGFDDDLEAALLRVKALDEVILLDRIQVDITGVGSAVFDRLSEMPLRAPVAPYGPWLERQSENYSAGLLKK